MVQNELHMTPSGLRVHAEHGQTEQIDQARLPVSKRGDDFVYSSVQYSTMRRKRVNAANTEHGMYMNVVKARKTLEGYCMPWYSTVQWRITRKITKASVKLYRSVVCCGNQPRITTKNEPMAERLSERNMKIESVQGTVLYQIEMGGYQTSYLQTYSTAFAKCFLCLEMASKATEADLDDHAAKKPLHESNVWICKLKADA